MRRIFVLVLCAVACAGCERTSDFFQALSESQPPSASVGAPEPVATAVVPAATANGDGLFVCSFNIQFLGNSNDRDDGVLAELVASYDIVVVQELVSPPFAGTYPDGTPFTPDSESAEFFTAMAALGFRSVMSEEDTGTGDTIHRNGSSTEWWVAFYRPNKVKLAPDLPYGFLSDDRSNNQHFERVPYAFPFRTLDNNLDFVLISVHLQPGDSSRDAARRKEELDTIAAWIDSHGAVEHDFIIVGDMNIEDAEELASATPAGFLSLNDECRPTNTNVNGPKPYDHVMFSTTYTGEIDQSYDMVVVDLVDAVQDKWTGPEPFPGAPYNHNEFRKHFSDHSPIVFHMTIPAADDDVAVSATTNGIQ